MFTIKKFLLCNIIVFWGTLTYGISTVQETLQDLSKDVIINIEKPIKRNDYFTMHLTNKHKVAQINKIALHDGVRINICISYIDSKGVFRMGDYACGNTSIGSALYFNELKERTYDCSLPQYTSRIFSKLNEIFSKINCKELKEIQIWFSFFNLIKVDGINSDRLVLRSTPIVLKKSEAEKFLETFQILIKK